MFFVGTGSPLWGALERLGALVLLWSREERDAILDFCGNRADLSVERNLEFPALFATVSEEC